MCDGLPSTQIQFLLNSETLQGLKSIPSITSDLYIIVDKSVMLAFSNNSMNLIFNVSKLYILITGKRLCNVLK